MSELLDVMVERLRALPDAVNDADRLSRIADIESLKSILAAVQARETAAFVASQRAAARAVGVPAVRVGRGVSDQVALARRVSPHQGKRYCGWASVLTRELPETFAALERGETSEWRALIVARETLWCSLADRTAIDSEIAPQLAKLGDRAVEAAVKKIAYRLDPVGFTQRASEAANDRRVSVRPAPDSMCRLSALLPVAQGVAAYASLARHADSITAFGDERGRGQIMADTLVERITGQAAADAVPVEVELIITDTALFGGQPPANHATENADADVSDAPDREADTEPGFLVAYGPIPAPLARELALGDGARWLRRLYRHPDTRELAAMDTHRRHFTENQRRFVRLRDHGTCRTPYCDAPIRHIDHIEPHAHGGPTSIDNAQGLCASCNYAREGPSGYRAPRQPTDQPSSTLTGAA